MVAILDMDDRKIKRAVLAVFLGVAIFMFLAAFYPGFNTAVKSSWIIGSFSIYFFLAALAHAYRNIGWKATAIFFAVMILVSFSAEYGGTEKGIFYTMDEKPLLFEGETYYYSDSLPWHILGIPISLILMWSFIIYTATYVAAAAFGPLRKRKAYPYLVAVFTAIITTAWDVSFDPLATRLGFWTWVGGGSAFPSVGGIPFGNFTSWFLITLLAVGLFIILTGGKSLPRRDKEGKVLSLYLFLFIFMFGIAQREYILVLIGAATQLVPWYLANR